MLTVEKRIISRNFTRAGAGRKIEYIVIHYFGSLGTAAAFKAKCAAEGIPQAQIIKKAIEDFLSQ